MNTDWIGIYNPGDVPGDIGSITWDYLPESSGTLVFHYPDQHELEPGEYWAGLFCCDGYDLYAKTSFVVTEASTGIHNYRLFGENRIYPNPSNGLVTVRSYQGEQIEKVSVYSLTGQLLFDEDITGMITQKNLNLSFLRSGSLCDQNLNRWVLIHRRFDHSIKQSI